VGLHRPRTDDPAFKGLSPVDASTKYRQMLDMVATYLNEMEVPGSIVELMVVTGSSDIRWVNHDDNDLRAPPSIAEWVDASCGTFFNGWRPQLELLARAKGITIGEVRANLTQEDVLNLGGCEEVLLSNHRDRLAPP
jgi:hypothetical protein